MPCRDRLGLKLEFPKAEDRESHRPRKVTRGGIEETGEVRAEGWREGAEEVEQEGKEVEADEAEGVDDAKGDPL